jgi:hypothetical protein
MAKPALVYEKTGFAESAAAWGEPKFSLRAAMSLHARSGKISVVSVGPQTCGNETRTVMYPLSLLCGVGAYEEKENGIAIAYLFGAGKGCRELVEDFCRFLELGPMTSREKDEELRHCFRAYHSSSNMTYNEAAHMACHAGRSFDEELKLLHGQMHREYARDGLFAEEEKM